MPIVCPSSTPARVAIESRVARVVIPAGQAVVLPEPPEPSVGLAGYATGLLLALTRAG